MTKAIVAVGLLAGAAVSMWLLCAIGKEMYGYPLPWEMEEFDER